MGEVISLGASKTQISGGEVAHGSTEFWGKQLFEKGKAHFYLLHPHGYERLCTGKIAPAFIANGQSSMLHSGDYSKCKRCMNRINNQEGPADA